MVNGVLENQADHYIHTSVDMDEKITNQAIKVMDSVGLENGVYLRAPVREALDSTQFFTIFLNNTMITIIFFLGILCV